MMSTGSIAGPGAAARPLLLVEEMAHRIVNEYTLAISSLSLAAARSSSTEAKATLAQAARRLQDYAEAHRALQAPATSGPIELSAYLQRLCGAIVRAGLEERGVSLTLIQQTVMLEAERCWRVGLIVSELITNAVRHGFGGQGGAIVVEVMTSGRQVRCRVADNGRPGLKLEPGRGSRIVDALAQELDGRVERRFGERGGAVVVTFPAVQPGPDGWP